MNLLLALIVLSVLSVFIMHAKSGVETQGTAWALGSLSVFLFIAGWYVLNRPKNEELEVNSVRINGQTPLSGGGMLLAGCGLLVALLNSYMFEFGISSYLFVVLGFATLILHRVFADRNLVADHLLTPFLSAMTLTVAASALGNPLISIFPAVILFLLVFVFQVTLNTETEIRKGYQDTDEESIYLKFRKRFAWTASVFFLFGVVSFWPWLGMLYGDAYFWLLAIGVIIPLVFFWGRLRQPRSEGPVVALMRFNRISPIITCILLIAFAIG